MSQQSQACRIAYYPTAMLAGIASKKSRSTMLNDRFVKVKIPVKPRLFVLPGYEWAMALSNRL